MKHVSLNRIAALMAALLWMPGTARADHRDLTLLAAPVLIDSGLMAFLLPRFSLKTGIKIHVVPFGVPDPEADIILEVATGAGRLVLRGPVLRGLGQDFAIVQTATTNTKATRFTDWLFSDVGQRTIGQFRQEGVQAFEGAANSAIETTAGRVSGDEHRGEVLAYKNCGRCHVIGQKNRMNGIGSTPSFALLRSFDDWLDRFQSFYVLNPHPSFTQIRGVTAPFDPALPPPISPLVLTQDEVADIIAFTQTIKPADLGAPLAHQ